MAAMRRSRLPHLVALLWRRLVRVATIYVAVFIGVALLGHHLPLALTYGVATLAALGVNGLSLMTWVRKGSVVRHRAELIEHTN